MDKSKTLLLFSLAEQASALEMLAAAKVATQPKLVRGFIAHATDEYRHAKVFQNLAKKTSFDSGVAFKKQSTLDVKLKKYVDTDNFLVERYSSIEFSVFVAVHESLAVKEFKALARKHDVREDVALIRAIVADEYEHKNTILDDEYRHAQLARNWVLKHAGLKRLPLTIKHWLLAKTRKIRGNMVPVVAPVFVWLSLPFTLVALYLVRVLGESYKTSTNNWLSGDM